MITLTDAPMSHPSVQECLQDAKYTSYIHAKSVLEQGFKLCAKITTDKGTARIAFKDSALTQYGKIWSGAPIPDPLLPIMEASALKASTVYLGPNDVPPFGNIPPTPSHAQQQQTYDDPYAKGKRPMDGGGRGQTP
jgi:hypothetical protein